MTKFVKMKDHSGEGKLTVNAKDRSITFVKGRAAMDNAMFEELKAYHGDDRFEEDPEFEAEVRENAKKQYGDKRTRLMAEAVTDAIVEDGINTTAPVQTDGAFTNAVSPDEESPTVVAVEQSVYSGEFEAEQEKEAKRAETRERAAEERREKTREAMYDQEAESIGVPRDEFKTEASATEPDESDEALPGDTDLTDTQKKQAAPHHKSSAKK